MLTYILKNIIKRKGKYILSVLVISATVLLFVVINSLSIAYKSAANLPFKNIESSIIIQKSGNVPEETKGAVLPCSMVAIQSDYVKNITNLNNIKNISTGLFLWVFDKDNFKRVMGVDWGSSLGKKLIAGIISGRNPQNNKEVLIEQTFANQHNLNINMDIDISGNKFMISGIVQMAGKNMIESDYYADLKKIQDIAYNSKDIQETEKFNLDDVNIIFIDVDQSNIKNVSQSLTRLLASQSNRGMTPTGQAIGTFTVSYPQSFEKQISSFFLLSDKLLLLILLTIIIGSILIIISSLNHNVLERTKEFGIMRAVGFTNMDIQKIIIMETFLLLIIGFVSGIILSAISVILLSRMHVSITIPWELNPFPHFLLSNPSRADTIQSYLLPVKFQVSLVLLSAVITFATGLLTIAVLVKSINKFKVMEVLRHE